MRIENIHPIGEIKSRVGSVFPKEKEPRVENEI
jgi:hypothetical protein